MSAFNYKVQVLASRLLCDELFLVFVYFFSFILEE